MTDIPDTITREEADARVTAALRKAAEDVRQWGSLLCGSEDVTDEVASDILALIPDAGGAFDRAVAEAVQAEREACARLAYDAGCGWQELRSAALSSSFPEDAAKHLASEHAAFAIAAAIRATLTAIQETTDD